MGNNVLVLQLHKDLAQAKLSRHRHDPETRDDEMPDDAVRGIIEKMIDCNGRSFTKSHWMVIAGLGAVDDIPGSFEEIYGWIQDEVDPDISRAALRRAFAELEKSGFVEAVDVRNNPKRRGPKARLYCLSDEGKTAFKVGPYIPILRQAGKGGELAISN